jgi:AcrR family transcriptional regulator
MGNVGTAPIWASRLAGGRDRAPDPAHQRAGERKTGARVSKGNDEKAAFGTARPSYAEQARELLHERLLVAADDLLADREWQAITMADIARGAGVSRQTLYNEFGSRQEFAQAYVLREADRFVGIVERAIADHADDHEVALAAALTGVLAAATDSPLVHAIVADEPTGGLLALVTTQGAPVVGAATDRMAAVFVATWPELPERQARIAADCATRLAISHALLPTGSPNETATAIAAVIAPYLHQPTDGGSQ